MHVHNKSWSESHRDENKGDTFAQSEPIRRWKGNAQEEKAKKGK